MKAPYFFPLFCREESHYLLEMLSRNCRIIKGQIEISISNSVMKDDKF